MIALDEEKNEEPRPIDDKGFEREVPRLSDAVTESPTVTPVVGLSSYASEGDDDDDQYYEDRTREFLYRIDLGALMGVHYLFGEGFGIGAETGFVTSVNNLKKTNRDEPDKHIQLGFFIPFSLRAAYHF